MIKLKLISISGRHKGNSPRASSARVGVRMRHHLAISGNYYCAVSVCLSHLHANVYGQHAFMALCNMFPY